MGKLQFLQTKKSCKGGRKSTFFKHVEKHSTALKFALIAAVPALFFIYDRARKRKKLQVQEDNFYLGVAVYTVFSIVALVFVILVFSQNIQYAQSFSREKRPPQNVSQLNSQPNNFSNNE
jgi:hypothetical protein